MSEVSRLSHGAKFTADVALVVVICGTCWDSLLPIKLSILWWSEMHDLNVRPPAPKAGALPDCANLGYKEPLSAILEM